MKKSKWLALVLCAALILGLAGCGKGGEVVPVDETKQLPTGALGGSQTYVDNDEDPEDEAGDMPGFDAEDPGLGAIPDDSELPDGDINHPEDNADGEDGDGDEDPAESDPAESDSSGSEDDDPPVDDGETSSPGGFSPVSPGDTGEGPGSSTVDRPGSGTGNSSSSKYRFQRYVLSGAEKGNFVFSGEAILTAVNMWSEMILDPDHRTINKYLARDYLAYEDHGGLEMINRVWLDDPLDAGDGAERVANLFYQMDMSDENATADKDEWVAIRTDGYITGTPAQYSDKTRVDLMSIPYLSDTWKAGTLHYDTKVRAFMNQDGTETRTYMCWDEGLTYWDMGNAKAYCMYLTGGHYAMFIVPKEGTALDKIDIPGLMSGRIESTKAHVAFYVPTFMTETSHTVSLSDFGLPSGRVASNVISNLPKTFEPELTQITKISVTPYGIGPIPESQGNPEQVQAPAAGDFDDGLDFVRIVCDKPFLYYVGDAWNEDIAFFGVMNTLPADQAVEF